MRFTKSFEVDDDGEARLHVTAHGAVVVHINGREVGDEVLAPGWTSYRHRLRYSTYDVTALLTEGPNAIGAHLAEGWFAGYLGFTGGRAHQVRNLGDKPAASVHAYSPPLLPTREYASLEDVK